MAGPIEPRQDAGVAKRLLLVDDDARFRGLLRMLLENEPAFDVVGEAGDGGDALSAAEQLVPEVVLDVNLPDTTGFALVPQLGRVTNGRAQIVLTSSRGDETYDRLARDAGARAFISKHDLTASALADALA
jgi:DNA-binding NarL/FixJ family response regulator